MKNIAIILVVLFIYVTASAQQTVKDAPAPIAPYSLFKKANGLLFISGQIPIDPVTKKLVSGDFKTEVKQVMENIGAILKTNGLDYSDIVKCSVFMTDLNNFAEMNEVYGSFFKDKVYPAREAMQVSKLPLNASIEISVIAVLKQ